jgi:hypothetical protein
VRQSLRNHLGLALLLLPSPLPAHPGSWSSPGSLVSVEVLVEGRRAPLHPAPDGAQRWYLEAREGARYAIRLRNRTAQRLAVSLNVDGLNVISGERAASASGPSDPGRMYVLEPWGLSEVRGWRTSLRDVQRFVFVDERSSYAARTGRDNARMGWIELAVYRERYPRWPHAVQAPREETAEPEAARDAAEAAGDHASEARARPAPQQPSATAPPAPGSARRSFPGTGWGPRADDPAEVVEFDPEPQAAERVTLRYEYRQALLGLGIDLDPHTHAQPDRLWERERGERGFARPPDR